MAITEVAYCTREDVQRALNIGDVPRLNAVIDRGIMSGARTLEGALHRKFYPETKTVLFDQPGDGIRLWLDELELSAAPTQVLAADLTMTAGTDYFPRPKSGPPYAWLEAAYDAVTFWQSHATPQAAISVTSDSWNYPTDSISVATLGGSITAGAATLTLSDSSQAGVGSLILIDSERMIISDKTMNTTSATIAADVASSKSAVSITVSNGTLINPGELILIDSERMQVSYVTGSTLTVERAQNGSALAAHTSGATIYAPRTAAVLRARLGTAAASHSGAATIYRLQAPSLVRAANVALAIISEQQELGAYTQSLGSGSNQRSAAGAYGLNEALEAAYVAYGRKVRSRAV